MADEADRAQVVQEQALQLALGKQKTKPRVNSTGRCLWCNDVVGPEAMFCDVDCRDDYEKNRNLRGFK